MNVKHLIAAVAALTLAGAAFAEQGDVTPYQAGKTRAQVIEELRQAQADGSAQTYGFAGLNSPAAAAGQAGRGQSYNVIPTGKTRAEVMAELKHADASAAPTGFIAYHTTVTSTASTAATAVAKK